MIEEILLRKDAIVCCEPMAQQELPFPISTDT